MSNDFPRENPDWIEMPIVRNAIYNNVKKLSEFNNENIVKVSGLTIIAMLKGTRLVAFGAPSLRRMR